MQVMALVTAKSYSQRVQRKSFKELKGEPLYRWTTEFLHSINNRFTSLVFSSDEPQQFILPESFIPVRRPKILCEDCSPHILSVKHAVSSVYELTGEWMDWVVLFQPTNPVRLSHEVDTMLTMAEHYDRRKYPIYGISFYNDENISTGYINQANFPPECKKVMIRSGTMYLYNSAYLSGRSMEKLQQIYVQVPKHRGYNINNEEDFFITEGLMDAHNYRWSY